MVSEMKAWYKSQALWDGELFRKTGSNLGPLTSCRELVLVLSAGNLSEEQGILDCDNRAKHVT